MIISPGKLSHRPQDEAHTDKDVPLSRHELWSLQENGDIREFLVRIDHVPTDVLQRAKPATKREMTQFHSDDYVDFLSRITPVNMNSFIKEQHKCAISSFDVLGMQLY